MTRATRLAVVSVVALAVIVVAAAHLLVKPKAATLASASTNSTPNRASIVVRQQPVTYTGTLPLDTAEQAALVVVARSGLRILSLGRLDAPISRPPLIVTTNRGVLAVVTAPMPCSDAPLVARVIFLVGTQDPAARDHFEVGRIAGSIVMTADPGVWAAIEANPC